MEELAKTYPTLTQFQFLVTMIMKYFIMTVFKAFNVTKWQIMVDFIVWRANSNSYESTN